MHSTPKFSQNLPLYVGAIGLLALVRSEERRVGKEWSSDVCSSDLGRGIKAKAK